MTFVSSATVDIVPCGRDRDILMNDLAANLRLYQLDTRQAQRLVGAILDREACDDLRHD
jgi:hypothetical protein